MKYTALVVGGGIAGIRASLDLAETGSKVALIDRNENLGGILTQLDRQFPSDRCGMCRMLPLVERDECSQYCLRKGLYHENIDVMLGTELIALDGELGEFHATLRKKPTFVDPNLCIGCGECAAVCPARVPDEFNAGLSLRPAVHLPAPYTIPNHYVVDLDNCQRCWACFKACPTGAIDFRFEVRKFEEWLKDELFPLTIVRNGAEALTELSENDTYRLILLDMDLPDMTPEDMLSRILELQLQLRLVLMAGPENIQAAQNFIEFGVQDVITKPLEEKTLVP
ncbi:MAG: 4Fe-4S binding protein, partial [Deltaproteobacteria bacterium]|nr:4Fe-4S binding protein [Deltaproteobacteria bacterium]